MIVEWLKYLRTDCPSYLKKMGYLQELIAIESRYNRCRKYWQAHLEATKHYILQSASTAKKKRKALVFGSGYLYDLPAVDLLESFEEVILVDLVHMKPARKLAKKYKKLTLLEMDVTASLEEVYTFVEKNKSKTELLEIPVMKAEKWLDDPEIDFVLSLNLLSQLPIMVVDYLERSKKDFKSSESLSQENLDAFAAKIINNHLDYLQSFVQQDARVCLITDKFRSVLDKDEKLIKTISSLEGIKLEERLISASNNENWKWELAPYGELDHNYKMVLDVYAMSF